MSTRPTGWPPSPTIATDWVAGAATCEVGVRLSSTIRTVTTLRMAAAAAVTATSFVVRQRRRRDVSMIRSSARRSKPGGGSASGASNTRASAVSERSDTYRWHAVHSSRCSITSERASPSRIPNAKSGATSRTSGQPSAFTAPSPAPPATRRTSFGVLVDEQGAQPDQRRTDAGLGRAERDAVELGDLPGRVAVEAGEHDGPPLLLRQAQQRSVEPLGVLGDQRPLQRARRPVALVDGTQRFRRGGDRAADAGHVDRHVAGDREQP